MTTYTLRDDGGSEETIEAGSLAEAAKKAKAWVLEGSWDTETGPCYIVVRIWEVSSCEHPKVDADECADCGAKCSHAVDQDDQCYDTDCALHSGDDLTARACDEQITVVVPMPKPPCAPGEDHDWQSPYDIVGGCKENPGVWGHGGGVVINECCIHCGARKRTDTWAQSPVTGEQGIEEVTYERDVYEVSPRNVESEEAQ
jgi:hypothetical protein